MKHILPGTRHSEKTNRTSFCTLFLKLSLQFFLFRRNTNFSTALFQKGEQKQSGVSFYGITCAVCQVKFLRLLFSIKSPYTWLPYNPFHTYTENKPFRHNAAKTKTGSITLPQHQKRLDDQFFSQSHIVSPRIYSPEKHTVLICSLRTLFHLYS